MKIGQLVNVKCPAYKNGRKFIGKVTRITDKGYMVRIEGNSKSTSFAACWVSQLDRPRFSELTKAIFNL